MRTDQNLNEGITDPQLVKAEKEFLEMKEKVKGYKKNFDEFMDDPRNMKGFMSNQIKDLFDTVSDSEKEFSSKAKASGFPDDQKMRKERMNFFKNKTMRMKQKLPLLEKMAKQGAEMVSKSKVENAQKASVERAKSKEESKTKSERDESYQKVKGKVESFKKSKDFKAFGDRVRSHMK